MIFKGSRYQNVKAYQAVASNGQTVTALSIRFIPPTPAGFRHTFSAAERWICSRSSSTAIPKSSGSSPTPIPKWTPKTWQTRDASC
jgi:hypothetical protein